MGVERRNGRRLNVQWAVFVGHPEQGFVLGKVLNASLSGLTFVSPLHYSTQECVSLKIETSGDEAVRCVGLIVREKENSRAGYAYSVKIVRFAENDRTIYNAKLLELRRKQLTELSAA